MKTALFAVQGIWRSVAAVVVCCALALPAFAVLFAVYLSLSLKRDSVAQRPERLFREGVLMTTVGITVRTPTPTGTRVSLAPEAYCESMCVFLLLSGTTRHVPAGGLAMHVLEAGDPAAPLVLLLHGFAESFHTWRATIEALAIAGLFICWILYVRWVGPYACAAWARGDERA